MLLLYFSWNICIWPNCVLCCYPYNAYLHLCSKNMLLMFCCFPCNTCYYFVFFYDFNWIMNPIGTMILLLLSTGYLFMLMTSIGYLSMLMILLLLSIQLSVCARLQLDDICDLILRLLSIGLSVCAPLLYLIWCYFIFLIHAYLVLLHLTISFKRVGIITHSCLFGIITHSCLSFSLATLMCWKD